MKWSFQRELFPLAIIALYVLLSIYFNAALPEVIPSHFDSRGVPNGYAPKGDLIRLNLGIAAVLYLLLTFLPRIDPFWKQLQKRFEVFLFFRDVVLLFFLFIYLFVLLSAQRGRLDPQALGVGFGLLFVLLGNYLPKIPRNWFFGIRSPWTLASEEVWRKTHSLSGWLFVLAGAATAALSLCGINFLLVLIVILVPLSLFTAFAYPLYLYRKLQREGKTSLPEL